MFEREDVSEDVDFGADAAGGAELEAGVVLGAAEVPIGALQLEAAGFAGRRVLVLSGEDTQEIVLMRSAGETGIGQCTHEVLVFLLLFFVLFLLLGLDLVLGFHLLRVHLHKILLN